MLLRRPNNRISRLLDPQVHHLVPIVREDDVDQILSDIVHVTLHRGQHNRALLRPGLFLHLGLKIGDRLLHHPRGIKHRGQLHLARAEQISDRLHPIQQDRIDQLQRRILPQRLFQQLFQGFFMRALTHRLLAINDGKLQLVLDGQRVHMRGSRCRHLPLGAGKVRHVSLQRIPARSVAIDQFPSQVDFLLRNLVEGIDLGVVDDGQVEPMIHRLVHKDGIQHPPRIRVQTERNIADAQNRFNVR